MSYRPTITTGYGPNPELEKKLLPRHPESSLLNRHDVMTDIDIRVVEENPLYETNENMAPRYENGVLLMAYF